MQPVTLVGKVTKKAEVKQTSAGQLIVLTVEEKETYKGQSGQEERITQWPVTFWKERAMEVFSSVSEGDIVEVALRFSRHTGENEQGDTVTKTNITGNSCRVHAKALPPLARGNIGSDVPF